jgi:ribonuclease P protein 3
VDRTTGILQTGCLKGCTLHQVPLSARAWRDMTAMNQAIVFDGHVEGNQSQAFQGGKKGKKKRNFCPLARKQVWKEFTDKLDNHGPFDVVVDGANVGFYKQNFAHAPRHVDYDQIDWIVRHWQRLGKKVLLCLHERHFSPTLMPSQYKKLQQKWEAEGVLFQTPKGMNDDWFWLHAALTYKTLVVTNDEMRDHHFQMLAPKTFLRWKERHQVHFNFSVWEGKHQARKVDLVYPEPYSRRIQRVANGLVIPLAKRGDENRFLDGVHVACDDEPIEETYLCIRPNQPKSSSDDGTNNNSNDNEVNDVKAPSTTTTS